MVSMTWLENSPNRIAIQKLLNKREKIVMDVTYNGKHIQDYQRKLKKITDEIEVLYMVGGTENA